MQTLSQPGRSDTHFPPENDLLLCCARTHIDPAAKAKIHRLLQRSIDWPVLLQTARRHGVLPLLNHTLEVTCPNAVPEYVLAQLRRNAYGTALHNTRLTLELLQLLQHLQAEGTAVIPFKGPILAASVYQNLGLRQFCDLDILIPTEAQSKVYEVLISRGYVLHKHLGWQSHFIHRTRHINIDLHQRITPEFFTYDITFEEWWSRLESLSLGGATVQQLCPEDRLILLCLTLGKDCCHWDVRLAQLCDAAELLRRYPQLNWDQVWEQAHKVGCERLLLLDLYLIQELLTYDLPAPVSTRLAANPIVASLGTWVQEQLWQQAAPPPQDQSFWSFFWSYNHQVYFQLRERPQDKLTYCWVWLRSWCSIGLIPNEADREWLLLPSRLRVLYYPLHLVRLVIKRGIQPIYTKLWRRP